MRILEKNHVQDPVVRWAKEHGIVAIRFTPYGEVGWPDHIFVFPGGVTVWVEFKAPGKLPTRLQAYRHEQLRSLDHVVYVINNKELGIRILKTFLDPARVPEKSNGNAFVDPGGRTIPRSGAGKD